MTFLVDPTVEDLSPRDILLDLPTNAVFDRALAAADVDRTLDSADTGTKREHVVEELSVVDRRRVAAQVRFAAPRTMHYYRLPDLPAVGAADLDDLVGDRSGGGFGAQVRAVSEAHDRVYAVCSVPAGGTQARLSVSEASRVRTVAAFDPGTAVRAVRVDGPETAAGTLSACLDRPILESGEGVPLTDEKFLGRFEDECIEAYTQLGLTATRPDARTARIELTGKGGRSSPRGDLREDAVVRDLL